MSSQPKDHFALFGLARSYELDREALAKRRLALLSGLHPDRFSSALPAERAMASLMVQRINDAYGVLSDDVARARYLCELKGLDPDARGVLDEGFLARQMRAFERLEEARGDSAALQAIAGETAGKLEQTRRALCAAFDEDNGPACVRLTQQAAFLSRIMQRMR